MTTTGDLGPALVAAAEALDRAARDREPGGGSPGRITLTPVGEPLGGSRRSTVVRAAVAAGSARERDTGLPEQVVVKVFDPATGGEGWVREAAALDVLGRGAGPGGPASRGGAPVGPAPLLLAAVAEPPLVVLSDLGAGSSLADSLLGNRGDEAARHLVRWATALGDLHRRSADLRSGFEAALSRFGGAAAPAVDSSVEMLDRAAALLAEQLPALGIVPPAGAVDALRAPPTVTDACALTPADACPDNNLEAGGATTLLDFEGATFRHVAWDAAYLTVPWPSCWCSWRLEEQAGVRALRAWREAVLPAFPVVGTPAFEADLWAVRARWAFVSTAWFLERALAGDEAPAAGAPVRMPGRRALLLHRLGSVADLDDREAGTAPALLALARQLVERLTALWGPVPLELAPAFRRTVHHGPA
ncbi:hypothetical protein [Kineosporia sp. A_224]|uniref:hypothetical protein n=1 Tax=Kineosporia sp. A_224 TaxID=1962180 RepID=UPI000B4B23C3|nr:hypothetical protein [Kineosporia sp. A_224]